MCSFFGEVARFDVLDVCFESEDTLKEVYDLVKTSLEGSRDVFLHEESPSIGSDDSVIPNLLDHFHASPICSLSPPSPEYYTDTPIENPLIFDANVDLGYAVNIINMLGGNANNFVFLGCFSGFNASLDPYYMYLEDLPRKITWTTFFNPSFDFLWPLIKLRGYWCSSV